MIRRTVLLGGACLVAIVGVAACGEDDGAFSTLPPIETTTTTTTTTTTISSEPIDHVVQPGETLAVIAERHGVPMQAIIDFNDRIANADHIEAGQTIRIPQGVDVTALSDPGDAADGADDAGDAGDEGDADDEGDAEDADGDADGT